MQQDRSCPDTTSLSWCGVHPRFIVIAAWAVLGEVVPCSGYLSFLVSLCSHASEHLPLQMCLQPLIGSLKIMEVLMPKLTNGSFIHSFMHTHSSLQQQPASLCTVGGGGFWVLSSYAEQKDNSFLQRLGLVDCGGSSTGQNGAGQLSAQCLGKTDI